MISPSASGRRRVRRPRATFAAFLFATAPLLSQAAPKWAPAVVAAIEAGMREMQIPGLSCTIGVDGRLVFQCGFGLADVENEVPATAATVYRLGSISKPITAVLAMQLVEKGQLDLDRDVHTIVAEWPEKAWPVTTRQLLSHTAGVRHYRGEAESTVHYATQLAGLVRFANDPLLHEPGTQYLYSTYGYNLVAAVVETTTKQSFADLVRERIAVPCAAPTLQDDDLRRIVKHRAQGYVRENGVLQNSELMDGSYKLGGGGLCSSSDDLVRFAATLMAGKLVSNETLAGMWTPQRTKDGAVIDYALGFRIAERRGIREVYHGGAQARVSTFLLLLPERRIAIAVMCNLEHVKLQALARQIADRVLDAK